MVPNAVAWETFEEIIAHASTSNGYILRLSPGFYEMLATNVVVTNKSFVPLFTIDEARVVGIEAVFKTLLDYGLGVPLLMLTSPLMFLIAIGLQLTRYGEPVLTHYQTVGQGGMTFEMLKFNIRISSDARTGSRVHAMLSTGSSVSWLEQALYRTGLDKLPQLLNVLVGQMSLVGPRPRVIDEEADPQMVRNLQTVKPGILGPWATAEHWTSGDEIQDELYYVRNWTIWLDLQVLFDTLVSWMPGIRRARPIVTRQPRGRRSPHPPGLASKPHGSKARTALSPVLSKLGEGPKSYQHYDSTKNMGKRF
jgi:lipopolysaccharide/colanic/teichoic acid biosynthesis glycosyltransferase